MYYIGIDLHKHTVWVCILDARGHRVCSKRLPAGPHSLKVFFREVPRPFKVAVEATYNWYYVVDIAEEYAEEVYLANSYELKAFAKRHKKNDRIDAHLIAWLLQRGDLPTVMIPDRETRKVRELLRYRMRLVADKTRNISRLKALLDKMGMVAEGNFNTKKRREELRRVSLGRPYKEIVEGYLERIGELCGMVKRLNKMIAERAEENEDTVNLMSLPGLDYFSALLIAMEVMTIERFRSFSRLCTYVGLAPRVHGSGGHCYYGPLNRNRNKYLRWILLENVHHAIRKMPRLKKKYLGIKKRKGSNTAKVAVARDYLKLIYHVLKDKRPWYPDEEHGARRSFKSQSAEAPALCGV